MAVFLLIIAILQIIHIQFSLYSICWYLSVSSLSDALGINMYSYSICWYLSKDHGKYINRRICVFVQHLLIFIICYFAITVYIFFVFVQHLLIFITANSKIGVLKSLFSYSTCWYLSISLKLQKSLLALFSYSTCWYLS